MSPSPMADLTKRGRFGVWVRNGSVQLAMLLIAVATLVSCTGWMVRLDYLLFDSSQRLQSSAVADDVLIVAIDAYSLDRIGRWPWPRDVHAQVLEKICAQHPRVVGFDIAFVEPSANSSSDRLFADAVRRCGNVVLPLLIEAPAVGVPPREMAPIEVLRTSAAGLGRVGVHLDEDGIARSVHLYEGIGWPRWPLFAQELLRVGAKKGGQGGQASGEVTGGVSSVGALVAKDNRRIDFVGPAGTVHHISYAHVLNGQFSSEYFVGKTVLIGTTAVGLGDMLSTPTSGLAQPMPGVEVLANTLLGLRDDRLIETAPRWISLLVTVLLSLIPLLWLPRLMPLPALLVTVVWCGLVWLGFVVLLNEFHYWIEPSGTLIAALSAFPLWSWLRLESARHHLDQELKQLRSSLPAGSYEVSQTMKPRRAGFEQRIAWVQDAQRALREHEEQRSETLAFISHDLRVPLACAIQVLETEVTPETKKVLPSLRKALRMAQDFVLLSRAQALEPCGMQELDLLGILHQAADELFPLSQQCGVRMIRDWSDDAIWIKGDFDLLERATINLLHNAITHAPAGSDVGLIVERGDSTVSFYVENDGAPLPPHQIERLFQRFGRNEDILSTRVSTGLGLYFVRTVIEKHKGRVGVEFPPGRVRFRVDLLIEK